jgi:protein-disulfide isomerase
MPSKKSSKTSRSKRAAERKRAQRRSQIRTIGLIVGAIILAVAAVVVLAALDRGRDSSTDAGEPVSLDKSMGAEDAPVVVVEYGDFQCPYCKQFAAGAGQQVREEYVPGGQVRFVYRHLAFLGEESTWAAEASECADEQGFFWEYHDRLYEEQGAENSGVFDQENLKRFGAELGLDASQFDQCLESRKYRDRVQDDVNDARRRQIDSTPSLLVNGQLIRGGASYQILRSAIESALNQP